jgi:hypothetical protein
MRPNNPMLRTTGEMEGCSFGSTVPGVCLWVLISVVVASRFREFLLDEKEQLIHPSPRLRHRPHIPQFLELATAFLLSSPCSDKSSKRMEISGSDLLEKEAHWHLSSLLDSALDT